MKSIKHELQNIIYTDEPAGTKSQLKKVQNFLRRYAETGSGAQKQQQLKSEEAAALIAFAKAESLFYSGDISEENFIGAGAEQRGYSGMTIIAYSKPTTAFSTPSGLIILTACLFITIFSPLPLTIF